MGKGKGSGSGSGMGYGFGSGDYKGETERFWIPAMPVPLAVVCCVFNFLIPGFGTFIAGMCVFCCARTEDMDGSSKTKSCLVNGGIAFLQLLSAIFCFLGWVWSCYWGVAFIMMSVEYYHNNRVEDQDGRAAVPTPHTTNVIIEQPTHIPFRVVQPGAQPDQRVITKQPVEPPAYAGTSHGTNPSVSVYPDPPLIRNADGSEQKIGM